MGGREAKGFWKERGLIPHPKFPGCRYVVCQYHNLLLTPEPLGGWPFSLRMLPTFLATTTQDQLLRAWGWGPRLQGGDLILRPRPGWPSPKLSQSPNPADPNPICWQKVQLQGLPPIPRSVHSQWAASLSTAPQAPFFLFSSIFTNPLCHAQLVISLALHSQLPALAALRFPQTKDGGN